jgi:hypothetical protein
MDIDPAYIEVAIRRWQKLTGQDAIYALTGETFDQLVARRRTERAAMRPMPDPDRASRCRRLAKDEGGDGV